ncbi:MAG: hypothetical protein JNL12_13650 [Planctomycetes bacterium]|nr:hypothetical protein [Planctomycetota bacterium]
MFLGACTTEPVEPPAGHMFVQLTDTNGTPLPGATAWWLPDGAMRDRWWITGADTSWRDNTHEVLRRHGHAQTSDSTGRVAMPSGAWIAASHGELAGVLFVPAALQQAPGPLVLDDWQWVVRTVDEKGAPIADMLIQARPSLSDRDFDNVLLGQTDATGQLVVRAPGSIDFELPVREPRESHVPSPNVIVGACCLGENSEHELRPTPRRSVAFTLKIPLIERVEITPPEDLWPRGFEVSTHAKVPNWLAETSEAASSLVVYRLPGIWMDLIGSQWVWGRCKAEEPDERGVCRLTLPMPRQVTIVRARLLAADGAPCDRTLFQVARVEQQMISRAWSNPVGEVVLWLNTNHPLPPALKLEVASSVAPERIGQRLTLTLPELTAGKRCDLGTLQLSRP